MRRALSLLLLSSTLLAPSAAAQCGGSFVEGFTNFQNTGAWGWDGLFQASVSTGGNPGFYMRSQPNTLATPTLRTQDANTIFTTDYRVIGITSVGIDLLALQADPVGCQRPMTLYLDHDPGTPSDPSDDTFVYFVLAEQMPCVDGDWRSYFVDVDSASTTLPPGWTPDPASSLTADALWNLVIQDVTRLRWFFGDPAVTYPSSTWILAADNARVAWQDGPTTYCAAQQNSMGCSPAVEWLGVPSATQPGSFDVTASQVLSGHVGPAVLRGGAPVGPLRRRHPVHPPADHAHPAPVLHGQPGHRLHGRLQLRLQRLDPGRQRPVPGRGQRRVPAQYWSRDTGAPGVSNLSNAIRFEVCP